MTRALDVVGVHEIAALLDVSRQRAHQLTGDATFPDPAARLAAGPIWRTTDVARWIARHRPPCPPYNLTR